MSLGDRIKRYEYDYLENMNHENNKFSDGEIIGRHFANIELNEEVFSYYKKCLKRSGMLGYELIIWGDYTFSLNKEDQFIAPNFIFLKGVMEYLKEKDSSSK